MRICADEIYYSILYLRVVEREQTSMLTYGMNNKKRNFREVIFVWDEWRPKQYSSYGFILIFCLPHDEYRYTGVPFAFTDFLLTLSSRRGTLKLRVVFNWTSSDSVYLYVLTGHGWIYWETWLPRNEISVSLIKTWNFWSERSGIWKFLSYKCYG